MVILHIACIYNNPFSGVSNAVPNHVLYQSKHEKVALLNVSGELVLNDKLQLAFTKNTHIKKLPEPFNHPDLIVFHEVYYPVFIRLAIEANSSAIPYIIVPHGCLTRNAQKQKKYKKIIGNWLLFDRFISHAVALQYLSKAEAESSDRSNQFFVSSNGITIPNYSKHYLNKTNKEINIVYIGRLDIHSKGIDLLLEALVTTKHFLLDNNCHVSLYGPDQNGIYSYINDHITTYHLDECINLNNPIINEEKKSVLENADLFILTSRSEGMPMGVLEALSYGIPCIVTRGTTIGELLTDNNAGWMAETNADSIAATIIHAVKGQEEWCQMSRNAVMVTKKYFQWDVVCQNALNHYDSLINNNGV